MCCSCLAFSACVDDKNTQEAVAIIAKIMLRNFANYNISLFNIFLYRYYIHCTRNFKTCKLKSLKHLPDKFSSH